MKELAGEGRPPPEEMGVVSTFPSSAPSPEPRTDLPPGPGGASRVMDLMSRDVVTCDANDSCHLAAVRMRAQGVGILPVMWGGQVVGVVTDRDLVTRFVAEGGETPEDVPVTRCMTSTVVSVLPQDLISNALRLMRERSVRRLLVMEGRELMGILSLDDILLRLGRTQEIGQLIDELYVRAMARDWV